MKISNGIEIIMVEIFGNDENELFRAFTNDFDDTRMISMTPELFSDCKKEKVGERREKKF